MPRSWAILANWLLGAGVLFWPRFGGRNRRRIALLFTLGGLVSLVAAFSAEGSRIAATETDFLLAPAYATAQAAAAAGLPYHLLTVVCLTIGFAGLAVGGAGVQALLQRWWTFAVVLSLLLTALRFALEKLAADPGAVHIVGVTPLAPVVGALFAVSLDEEERTGLWPLLASLASYAWVTRLAVAAVSVGATLGGLGSHYDVSPLVSLRNPISGAVVTLEPRSLEQIVSVTLIPQLLIWPVYTVLAGLVGAFVARGYGRWRRS